MRSVFLISRTVLLEAIRRKEIYAIVLVSLLLVGAVMTVDFFKVEGLTKFYREVALKVMSVATSAAVIILAARQLPREFENRTIYPLLAKPIGRQSFIAGKLFGVVLAALFCQALFLIIFVLGSYYIKSNMAWPLLLQHLYLQTLQMLLLATFAFWLSLLLNLDAAITLSLILYATSSIITIASTFLYPFASEIGQNALLVFNYIVPQLTLFDLSEKVIHAETWKPLSLSIMMQLTLYGTIFITAFWTLAWIQFRRKAL